MRAKGPPGRSVTTPTAARSGKSSTAKYRGLCDACYLALNRLVHAGQITGPRRKPADFAANPFPRVGDVGPTKRPTRYETNPIPPTGPTSPSRVSEIIDGPAVAIIDGMGGCRAVQVPVASSLFGHRARLLSSLACEPFRSLSSLYADGNGCSRSAARRAS